jgi:glycosyltransferase involved in cell wall biosynthesis
MKKILLSIITPTLNNQKDIRRFFRSLENQDFPKRKLEIIIADGGSTDSTREIANRYGANIIYNKEVFADIGVSLGMERARGELFMVLASDNIFKSKNAISKMVEVFENKEIYAAFPKQISDSRDTVFSKYINTFTDPASHFVYGYASNPRTFDKVYKKVEDNGKYSIFDYMSSDTIPLIAFAQGFTVRAGFKRDKNNAFDDVAPVMEIVKKKKKIVYSV